MDRLWAPWRSRYVAEGPKEAREGSCLLCALAGEGKDRDNLILDRSRHSFILLNRYPYNDGHLMVAPFHHAGAIADLAEDELWDLMAVTKTAVAALDKAYRPQGYNVGMNLGRVAGAGIPDHLHLHVVPRWEGDTNFMPVLGETKVLNQSLDESYRKIAEALRAL